MAPKQRQKRSNNDSEHFSSEELKLELSEEKTLLTHTRDSAAKFLGYEITTRQSNTKHTLDRNGYRGRSINGDIGLKVPQKVVKEKCKRYMRNGKPIHRAELLNESDYTILATYQLEYRGIVNYYRMAFNLHTLQKLKWVMEQSLTKTLAAKHKISVRKVYQKYQAELDSDGKIYKGLQVTVPREGKKPLVATWGGIPLIWDINTSIEDQVKQYQWNDQNSKNGSWPRSVNNAEQPAQPTPSRFTISGHSKTWRSTQAERSRSGSRSWLPGSGKPWFFAIPAIWTFTMDAHPETRYHVHGQAEPDDAGKRSAVKAARYVWRGAFGKVPSADGNSPGAYPTRKMARLSARWSAMTAWLANMPLGNSLNCTGRYVCTLTAFSPR